MKWVKWRDVNQWKVNEYYDNKIDDLDKKNSTEANQNIYKEKKIVNLKDTKQNTIDQTKKSEDNHKVTTCGGHWAKVKCVLGELEKSWKEKRWRNSSKENWN